MAYAGGTELPARIRVGTRRAIDFLDAQADRLIVAGITVMFLSISAWWLSVDTRLPDGDHSKHIVHAFGYLDQFRDGHWLSPILLWTEYPPLVHVVGAVGAAVGGASVSSVVLAENLVFVPLLAIGCYQVGSIVFGRLAGVLAVLFAFAALMVIGLFHRFMLDGPGAAVAAVSVWFLLASKRFRSLPWTLASAVAIAAGMYVKATFIFFVAGLVVALLVRGGWRHWKHAVLGFGLFLILVEPWYFAHLQQLRGMATGAIQAQAGLWYGPVPYPERWSVDNFTWYAWNVVNNQLYVPLTAFVLVGLAVSLAAWWRRRPADSYVPELVVGAIVAYVGISLVTLDDPRYTLPGMVYLAALGTGWVTYLRGWARTAAVVLLAAVFCANTVLINFVGGRHEYRIELPGATESPIRERGFMVAGNLGYGASQPDRAGYAPQFVGLLERAKEDGARQVVFQPESLNSGGYNLFGLTIFARTAGLEVPGFDWRALQPNDVYVFRAHPTQAGRPPCLRSWDDTGIYMHKGPPSPGNPIYCPPLS